MQSLSIADKDELYMYFRQGVALLDREKPGWREEVRRKTTWIKPLNMSGANQCVLGKLYSEYNFTGFMTGFTAGVTRLGITRNHHRYGFNARPRICTSEGIIKRYTNDYSYLETLWEREIGYRSWWHRLTDWWEAGMEVLCARTLSVKPCPVPVHQRTVQQ